MKLTKYIGIMAVAAGMLPIATSCSDDWSPLSSESTVTTSASNTLWQNIVLSPQLSQFAALVQKAGYVDALNTSNYYTVWAPLNDSPNFDYQGLMAADSAYVRKTFIKNLVSPFGHEMRTATNDRITMLNDKIYTFSAQDNTFGGVKMSQTNLPNSNGILHILNGNSTYRDNLYEAMENLEGCDSVGRYFRSKDQVTLDTKNSVVGPMVNGKQTYLDSVLIYSNKHLTNTLRVNLEAEDSSYTFLAPTNEAWVKLYNSISPNYTFATTTRYQNLSQSQSAGFAPTGTDATYYPVVTNTEALLTQLKDSLTKRAFTDYLFYNNNIYYNRYLADTTIAVTSNDTLYTSRGKKLSNAKEILDCKVGDRIKQSNGYIVKVNDLPFHPWETYMTELQFGPRANLGRTLGCQSEYTTIYRENLDPAIGVLDSVTTSFTYYHYSQKSGATSSVPEVDLYMPGVMGHSYMVYLLTVPPTIENVTDNRLCMLNVTVNYCNANGTLSEIYLPSGNTATSNGSSLKGWAVGDTIYANMQKMDTICLTRVNGVDKPITFPVSYQGMGSAAPNIKIRNAGDFFFEDNLKLYCPDIRIIGVLLKPVELVEYEESQKKK